MSAIGPIAVRNTFLSLAAKRKREYRNVPMVGSRVRVPAAQHLVRRATIGVSLGSSLMFLAGRQHIRSDREAIFRRHEMRCADDR
jgi:hypothetical protein